MNLQEILSKLKALDGKFPYEALKAAITQREQIIPELLQIIEQAKENPEYLSKETNYMGHIYAMYLLAQFREKSAYPLIVEFFSIPPDVIRVREVTEDIIDKLGCVLASVCDGDDSLMKSLLENETADEYVRSEVIAGLITLVAQGQKNREELIAYFQSLFQGKLKRDSAGVLWSSLVFHSNDLYPEELYEDIKQAFTDNIVDMFFGSLEEIDNQLAIGKESVLQLLPEKYPFVDDAIAEIEKCIYFSSLEKTEVADNMLEMLELTYNTGTFPRKALTQAIALREQVIPKLLDFIQYAEKCPQEIDEQEDFMAHIYALFLLAQFREKRAYPLIIRLFSLPGRISLDITGDVVTEYLSRILASVYNGDDAPLKGLIENTHINEFVRNAALETFLVLIVCGQKSREEVMTYFQSLFRGKLEREYSHIWDSLVVCCTDLYPEEVYEDIQQAYADNLVESFFVGFDEVKRSLAHGKEKTLDKLHNNPRNTCINDTIQEMQDWACFKASKPLPVNQPTVNQPKPTGLNQPKLNQPKSSKKKKEKPTPRFSEPRKGPKIGRNAPCSCGSGKKYKKCCGT